MRQRLSGIAQKAKNPRALLEEAGRYMAFTSAPRRFAVSGPGWAAVARGGQPLRDTGRLASSLVYRVTGSDVVVGSPLVYSRIQNRGSKDLPGGVIRPTRGKYLAIPLSTLTVSERRTKGPRDFPNTFLRRGKSGRWIVWQKLSRGSIRPLFVLVESVKITARPYLTWTRADLEAIGRRWRALLAEGDD